MKTDKNFDLIRFGQTNPEFTLKDFIILGKLKMWSKQHQKFCVYRCNGVGVIKGKTYFSGAIDDYARHQYGNNVENANINDDENIFDIEADKVLSKIEKLIKNTKFTIKTQGDPRGETVRIFYNGKYIYF